MIVSGLVFISCGDSRRIGEAESTGSARLSLTNAPADAPCLQITVAGTRTVVDSFPITPGESTTFLLRGLPLGGDQFSGAAYPTSCDAVTTSSVANWVSDPVAASLAAGIVVDVTLVMHRNGRANVSIDFQDDPDAGTGPADGGHPADAVADAAACSPEAVVATAAQAAAAVRNMLESTASFCLPGQTINVAAGASLSTCSTAACANMPNTCTATLGSPTFAFDPANLSFTATADITVSGGAAGAVGGIPVNCNDLVITAPGTSFSGTLIPTIQSIPNAPSLSNILYTVSNVVVHTNSLGVSGCSGFGGALDLAAGIALTNGLIEQTAANLIQGRSVVFPCPAPGGANGTSVDSGG